MRLKIRHKTEYAYDAPVAYALQRLRLYPRSSAVQKVDSWTIGIEGAREQVRFVDHLGNDTRLVSVEGEPHTIVLTAEGDIDAAANVENASYGLSLCAETNAIMAAVSAGARRIARIAVIGYPASDPQTNAPAMPCGRCRQIMVEFAPRDAGVLLVAPDGSGVREIAVGELLPHAFDSDALS